MTEPAALEKPDALLLDLDALTQKQLDRALNSTGRCKYSAPCILGAMMPDSFIDYLKQIPLVDRPGRTLDDASIYKLLVEGLVQFKSYEQMNRAVRIQQSFDGIEDDGYNLARLQSLSLKLPHLKVPHELPTAEGIDA